MKRSMLFATVLITVCLCVSSDVWSRGGRGGGGGRGGLGGGGMRGGGGIRGGGAIRPSGGGGYRAPGGGGYRGGGYSGGIGRTPSMSRPSGVPSSLTRPRDGGFASRAPNLRPAYGNLPTPNPRPGAGFS